MVYKFLVRGALNRQTGTYQIALVYVYVYKKKQYMFTKGYLNKYVVKIINFLRC